MKGFSVTKIIKIKSHWNFEQVIVVEALIHYLSKNWGKINRFPDGSEQIDVPHTLAISPDISVKDKHVNTCGWGDHLNTTVKHLVPRGKLKIFTVEINLIPMHCVMIHTLFLPSFTLMYIILMTTPLLTHSSHIHVLYSHDCSTSDSSLSWLLHYDSLFPHIRIVYIVPDTRCKNLT